MALIPPSYMLAEFQVYFLLRGPTLNWTPWFRQPVSDNHAVSKLVIL